MEGDSLAGDSACMLLIIKGDIFIYFIYVSFQCTEQYQGRFYVEAGGNCPPNLKPKSLALKCDMKHRLTNSKHRHIPGGP